MSIKLVAIDLDGTLLNSQHQITPAVKEAVIQAKIKVSVSYLHLGDHFLGSSPTFKNLG